MDKLILHVCFLYADICSDVSNCINCNAENCDLFIGDWVPDPSGPIYTNESCHVIEGHQNCMKNGRPDSGYLFWRWKPRDCEIPRFNPERFLDLMRDKSWGFIGDSISRNHVQSLLCILSKVHSILLFAFLVLIPFHKHS